jgi:putative sigma-54 modulation protein
MLILVHANGFVLERELRKDAEEKIDLALSRFDIQIGKVNVYLADLNGPKKGIDKSIRLVIDIERQPVIVVEEKGEDWQALLESISDRASHTVSRQLDRSRGKKGRTSMAGDQDSNDESSAVKVSDSSEENWNPLSVRTERSE